MDGFCCDFDEFYYMNDCEEGVYCLRRIIRKYVVNEYNINRIFYVSDNDLEDKFRGLLKRHFDQKRHVARISKEVARNNLR